MTRTLRAACGIAVGAWTLWLYRAIWTAGYVYEDSAWQGRAQSGGDGSRWLVAWTWTALTDPRAAHALNLGLHLLAGALLYLLLRRLDASRAIAACGAGLLLVHVEAVEAVAYVSGRAELIAAVGVLAACLAATSVAPWRWPAVGLAIGLGFAGKESAVAALALVPLTLWAVRSDLWRRAAVYGGLVAGAGVWWYGGLTRLANLGDWDSLMTWREWALIQSAAAHRLMVMAAFPGWEVAPIPHYSPLVPTVAYDYDGVTFGWRVAGAVFLGAVVALALWLRPRQRLMAFGLGWALLSVAPRLVIQTPRSYLNEHQMYTPLIGLLVAGAAVVAWGEATVRSWISNSVRQPAAAAAQGVE